MGAAFLDLARQGKNRWWRYVLSLIVILFCWLILGSLPYLLLSVAVTLARYPNIRITPTGIAGIDPLLTFILLNFSFVMLLVGLWFAVRWIHQRRFTTLITPQPSIRWRRIGQGLSAWFIFAFLSSLVEFLYRPAAFQITFDPFRFVPFAVAILILTPVQTSAEELLFRGYLMQSSSLITRWRPFVLALPAFLFTLGHLANPEIQSGFWLLVAYYFGFGLFAGLITLRDDSLELALGVHAANNLWGALFANYANSALQTPAVVTATSIDAVFNLVSFVVTAILFYLLFFGRRQGVRP